MSTFSDKFFADKAVGALWDVAVSIKRGNPLPLDKDSVVHGITELNAIATGSVSYPGQIIAVIEDAVYDGETLVKEESTTLYYLDHNKTPKEVGKIPTGDNKTIEVSAAGAISLLGAVDAANGTLPMIGDDGKLTWKTLEDIGAGDGNDNTTYEFTALTKGEGETLETYGFKVQAKFNGVAQGDPVEFNFGYTNSEIDAKIAGLEAKIGTAAIPETSEGAGDGKAATGVYKYVDDEINGLEDAISKLNHFTTKIVTSTDEVTEIGVLYLIKDTSVTGVDKYNEYLFIEGQGAVLIGDTTTDLSNYYTKEQADAADDNTTYTLSGNGVTVTLTPSEGEATTATLDVYTKSETDTKIDEKIASVTGGESAADVKLALESYRDALNKEVWGDDAGTWTTTTTEDGKTTVTYTPQYGNTSRIDTLETKVQSLENVGAQANVIEAVIAKTGNTLLGTAEIATADKTVTIDDSKIVSAIADAKKAGTDANTLAQSAKSAAESNTTLIGNINTNLTDNYVTKTSLNNTLTNYLTATQVGDTYLDKTTAGQTYLTKNDAANTYLDKTTAEATYAKATDFNTLSGTVSTLSGEVEKKANASNVYTKAEIGTITEGKTIVQMIADAQTAATYDDTQIKKDIKANTDAIAILNGTVEETGSVAKIASDAAKAEVAALVGEAPETLDTIHEIAAWITNDEDGAAALTNRVAANEKAITETLPAAIAQSLTDAKKYTDDTLINYTVKSVISGHDALTVSNVDGIVTINFAEDIVLNGGGASVN